MSSNSNNRNNDQILIPSGTHYVGQNFSDDQFNSNRVDGGPGATSLPAPSGTHAQQHNLHTLNTPLPSGGDQTFKEEMEKIEAGLPHAPHAGNHNMVSQNQQSDQTGHTAIPFSSQRAVHTAHGSAAHSGLATDAPGVVISEPSTVGNNRDLSTQFSSDRRSHGGASVDHDRAVSKDDELEGRGRGRHISQTGNRGSPGFNTSLHGPTSKTTTNHRKWDHSQGRTGQQGVSDATGAHGTGVDLTSSRRQTAGGHDHTSTSGRNDKQANHNIASVSESEGQMKPSIGDRIVGMAEKVHGKVTGNPALVAQGELRMVGSNEWNN